jgi:hypothetical protein
MGLTYEESWFDSQQGKKKLSHLQSIQIRTGSYSASISMGVIDFFLANTSNRVGADHSPASSTKFNERSYTNTAQCALMVCTGTNLPFPFY